MIQRRRILRRHRYGDRQALAMPDFRRWRRAGREEPTDLALLDRMRGGSEAALERLYARYAGLVFTLALRVVHDHELAREVLQDTFLRCWDGRETYDATRGRVAWWLMGIARHRAIDLLRSRSHQARLREGEPLLEGPSNEPSQLDPTALAGLRQAVADGLAALPAEQRQAIELAYYAGLTQSEIARELGQPLGTVKSRTRQALDRLRVLLWPLIESETEVERRRD